VTGLGWAVEVQKRHAEANGDLAAKKLAEWKERRPPTFTQGESHYERSKLLFDFLF
jgi:hypothetical protein